MSSSVSKRMGDEAMLVCEIMNGSSPICTEDMALEKVYELIEESGQDDVTVVDSLVHKIPIGIITVRGICAQILGRGRDRRGMTAANVMNVNYIKVDQNLSVENCQELMDLRGVKKAVVVDDMGSFMGSLTRPEVDAARAAHPVRQTVTASVTSSGNGTESTPFHIVQGGGKEICWYEIL